MAKIIIDSFQLRLQEQGLEGNDYDWKMLVEVRHRSLDFDPVTDLPPGSTSPSAITGCAPAAVPPDPFETALLRELGDVSDDATDWNTLVQHLERRLAQARHEHGHLPVSALPEDTLNDIVCTRHAAVYARYLISAPRPIERVERGPKPPSWTSPGG